MKWPGIKGRALKDIIDSNNQLWGNAGSPEQAQDSFDLPYQIDSDDSDYDSPMDYNFYDTAKNMVRVVHMEYWETYQRCYFFDPRSGEFLEFDPKLKKDLETEFAANYPNQELVIEKINDKRVKWVQFTGEKILYDDISPHPYKGFSIVPVFAYRDVSRRTANHFGIVRMIKDPQREVNKRWSQALNLLNQQVQPGVYAETEAFVDDVQAKLSLKESGSITMMNSGALSQNKIKERTVPSFPNAPMQMEEFSQDIMKKITGINPDLMGEDRGRQEPGVVIRLRQQQGLTLLKPLFKNFNHMKKELYKRQLAIIMEFMPDSQILRILGQGERYVITPDGVIIDKMSVDQETGEPTMTATIRDARNLEYDIIAEEAPGNMTKRMLELSVYTELMQTMPVDPLLIIEKLELSATEKARWSQYIQSQQQAESQQQQEMMEAEMGFKDREIAVKEQSNMIELLLGIAKVNTTETKDQGKLAAEFRNLDMEEQRTIAEFVINLTKLMTESQLKAKEIETKGAESGRTGTGNTGTAKAKPKSSTSKT